MGWIGRAPAPNGFQSAPGACMGKNTLHLIGLDARGAIVLREKVARGLAEARLRTLARSRRSAPASERFGRCPRQQAFRLQRAAANFEPPKNVFDERMSTH